MKMSEAKALEELRGKHSYLMFELRQKDERYTMISSMRRGSGKMSLKPAVAIKLVVPQDSVLGKQIVDMRKANERKTKREGAKKQARRAARQ